MLLTILLALWLELLDIEWFLTAECGELLKVDWLLRVL